MTSTDQTTAKDKSRPIDTADTPSGAGTAGEQVSEGPGETQLSASEAAAGEGSVDRAAAPELLGELETLRQQVEEMRDGFLRARAEADNIRKRAQGEVASARKFALESFATELLNVRDSLDLARAVNLEGAAEDLVTRMVEGLDLTLKQFDTVFEKFTIFEVDPQPGDKLDPESHQAMSMEESADIAPNHICRVVQKGYRLHDRLLRPAMVIVAKTPASG